MVNSHKTHLKGLYNYPESIIIFADLTQTLQALQERVNTLERNLMPFTIPYPTMPTYAPYTAHMASHGKLKVAKKAYEGG